MIRLHTLVPALGLAAAAALGLAGCGDNGASCGTGTVLQNGVCVPTDSTSCGTGTVLVGDECVPDGSVICEQGTVYDTASGQCVVDPSACADGTVLVSGQCVPEDETLVADLDEAAEPNDDTGAGQFNVPALNDDIVLHGCISPRGGQADEDIWVMTASGPTLLEITADGVGGLAAGFLVQDAAIPSLPNWVRFGINLTGDTSRRQVYLPVAGTYLLVMDDSRALLLGGEVAGSADTCYYTTVKNVPLPAATALTAPETTGTDSGNVRVLTYTADATGDILSVMQSTTSESMSPSFVMMNGSTLVASAAPDTVNGVDPIHTIGGLDAGTTLTIVVDNRYNFSPNPQPYVLDVLELGAQALPTDGSTITLTGTRAGSDAGFAIDSFNYSYFDVAAAGGLIHFDITSSIPVNMILVRKDILTGLSYQVFAAPNTNTTGTATFTNQFARFLQAGRYYLMTRNPTTGATVGETYMVTSRLTAITPGALTYGTAATAQPLPASGSAFHTIDFTSPTWVQFAATGTNWGTNVAIGAFDLAGEGVVGLNYNTVFTGTRTAAGTNPFGRVMVGDTRDFLIRVQSSGGTLGADPTYDLTIGDRPHVNLMTIEPGTPIERVGEALAGSSFSVGAQNASRYLVLGPPGANLSITVTPEATSDPIIRRRGVDEASLASADTGFDGDAETLNAPFGAGSANWIAFTVGEWNTDDTTFDLTLTATPPPYTVASGTIAYADVCAGGTTVMTGQDDTLSATVTLPAGLATVPFFGAATAGGIRISSNGWFTFDTTTTTNGGNNGPIPDSAAPNAMVAPYWEDLTGITVCTQANGAGDTFTVQWTGILYNVASETVQMQAVIHASGVIDFIYGPNHTLNGSELDSFYGGDGATVGVENASGTQAVTVLFNTNGIAPGTSRTLTPNP